MLAYWPEFLIFASAHVMSLISPGPDFLMVVQSSLRYSRKTALWVAFGISCGELIHVGYSLLGISWLIGQSVWFFSLLKYIGGAYLVYLGVMCLRAKKAAHTDALIIQSIASENLSVLSAVGRGFLTNALNVKAAFFTISFFTVLVSPTTPLYVQLMYGAFIQFSTLIWFGIVAFFLTNPLIQGRFLGMKHWIERVCGAVLIALGVKLTVSDLALAVTEQKISSHL